MLLPHSGSVEEARCRIRDLASYFGVFHQRVTQICKLPGPEQVDGVGPLWEPVTKGVPGGRQALWT
jgi:hypothetical protein